MSNFFEDVIVPVVCPSCKHENSFTLEQIEGTAFVVCRHCSNRIKV